jgi:hypothetical protein
MSLRSLASSALPHAGRDRHLATMAMCDVDFYDVHRASQHFNVNSFKRLNVH